MHDISDHDITHRQFKEQEDTEKYQTLSFLIIAEALVAINLVVCITILIILCCKRHEKDVYCFVMIQVVLTTICEIFSGIDILITRQITSPFYGRSTMLELSLSVLTFVMSQWVFVYHCLKVANLIPLILSTESYA